MKHNFKKGLLFLILLSLQFNLFSQNSFIEQKSKELVNSQNADFWSGRMFYFPMSTIKGSPFLDSEFEKSDFYYNGKYYGNVIFHFDIVNNEFIVKSENGNWIVLQSERIDSVKVGKSAFKYFENINKLSVKKKAKLYEVFETDKASLIIDHNKELEENIINNSLEREYKYNSNCYIYKDGKVVSVSSAKGVINLFSEKRKELKAYYKDNDKFKNLSSAQAIKAMVQYYSEL
ncbi:hypothetical protein [Polluticaenibacter yanchengensis]|uniref:WG repeat-containing protein n=1 Tax=Polluticaenibacter yanchengensis TaxID=3014562 RepID=A0ABT4UH69_9BACT|nr:hypothetical protein [Chitinophagaceae bacterium LY-5]